MTRAPLRALGIAAALALPGTASAQGADARASRRWHLSGTVGLVSRGDQPWTAVFQAVRGSGWDAGIAGGCQFICPKASDFATGRPAAFGAALRYRVRRNFQVRGSVVTAPFGTFRAADRNRTPLAIRPAATSIGVQGLVAVRTLWFGGGPLISWNRVEETAGGSARTSRSTRLGTMLAAGLTLPAPRGLRFEAAVERRWPGTVRAQALSVSGTANVPSMRVPMTHTTLWVGLAIRR